MRELGRGGMGTVYEVHDRVRDVRVALKTVMRLDPQRVVQLKREFRAVAELRHPNLVHLYDLEVADRGCFFTMELVRGRDLRGWVRVGDDSELAHAETGEIPTLDALEPDVDLPPIPPPNTRPPPLALDESRLRDALAQLADGLAFLHESGKVHRDIKPSNALVTDEGRIVLLDFGLAAEWRPRGPRRRASALPLAGTVAYMAPEYLHGQRVSPTVDLYALGIVAYEAVTGAPPFSGAIPDVVQAHLAGDPPPARSLNPDLPEDLEALIHDLLAKDPAARPTAAEVRQRALGRDDAPIRRPRARPRFVGRGAELAALDAALSRAGAGSPRLAVVEGASGTGKTALVEEFLYASPVADVVAFRGRCYERENVSYRAFDQIVEALALDVSADDSARLPRHLSALARAFPVFAALAGPAPPDVTGDPRDERERAFEALADVLAERVAGSTGVLVIDDLQWADAGSLELLSVLCERRNLPLLIVATVRAEDREAAPPVDKFLAQSAARGRVDHVRLGPLEAAEVRELIQSVAAGPVGDRTLDAIASASAGSPYVAEAIANELSVVRDRSRTAEIDVRALEAARIDRLGRPERAVADAAAAAGGATTFPLLRTVTRLEAPRLLSAVHALEGMRLLRVAPTSSGDVAYDFYHDRLRALTYARLDDGGRAELHRRFAEAYDRTGGGRAHELRTRHWELAGRPGLAAVAALAAADDALATLGFERAAELYRRALRLGLPADELDGARERRADAVLLSSDFQRAAELCRELAEARDGIARERWLLRCAEAEIKLGELDRGVDTLEALLRPRSLRLRKSGLEAALDAARVSARVLGPWPGPRPRAPHATDDDESELVALIYRVVANFLSIPYPRESWEFVLRAIEHARRRGDRSGEACGLANISGYLEVATLGRFGTRFLRRARAIADDCGEPYAGLVVEAVSTMRCTVDGAWAHMREHATRGEAICRDMGMQHSWEASFLHSYHGLGEIFAGEIDRALDILEEVTSSGRAPDMFTRVLAETFRGRALVLAGRTDEADEVARELAASPGARVGTVELWLDALRGDVALARGDYAGAAGVAETMRENAARAGLSVIPFFGALRHALAATAHLGLARRGAGNDGAGRALAHAEALHRAGKHSFFEPTALRLVAQASAAAGRARRARAALERAEISASRRGGRLERWAVAALRGRHGVPPSPALEWITAGAVG